MTIDYSAAEALLPPEVTDWKPWLVDTAEWLIGDGYGHWAEDPLNLAIYATLRFRGVPKPGRPEPETPWLKALQDEFWRTRYFAPDTNSESAKPASAVLKVDWGLPQEHSMRRVLAAHERFAKEVAGDTRAAAALTLAWAMLEGRPE